ncbi:putative quinol monooxygenase [Croceibacterium xixiisoli]|uniref:putative quinol monooxygenase n=1 Tax=Croceibacterium xixiisoli TaxID=1476466 RepID=UPI001F1EB50C|nr:putative quinol monooxygenase [Croceibacterium xixiisoli]
MTIAVIGRFRFPVETVEQARLLMQDVIAATLAEPGCRAYSYAQDVAEPGLFHVTELWDSRECLSAHFATPHMQTWQHQRSALGFFDRDISLFELESEEKI